MPAPHSIPLGAAIRLTRPDQVLLIIVVYIVGGLMGRASSGSADLGPLVVGAALVVLVAISVHAANEYADVETDALTTRTRFSGGSGAISSHGLPRSWALWITAIAGMSSIALSIGAALLQLVPGVVSVGLVLGLVLGWEYSLPPLALSRRGLGEVTNAALGGLLLPVTGAAAMGASVGAAAAAFVPFALLAFVNLLETQWPDRVADRAAGKHTLTSRLSLGALRLLAAVTALSAYASLVFLPPAVAWATLIALPFSLWGVVTLGRRPPGPSVMAMVVAIIAQGAAWATLG